MAIREVNQTHHWHTHHRPNACTAWVEETMPERVEELRKIITEGFEPKPPKVTQRWDMSACKWRTVCEPVQWPDQYVHHALIQVLHKTMMRGMDNYCCGSIKGKGPHYARKAIASWMKKDARGTKYEFMADIRHFYDSLKPEIVMDRMKHLIKDHMVLDLIERIVAEGILIGAYTSQWFANTVLQPLDALIRQSGLCKHYVRYMDNLTIFGSNKRNLRKLKELIEDWLASHGLELKCDWQIFPVPLQDTGTKQRLPDAVGYRYGRGFTIPRKKNYFRLKRSMARYRRRKRNGSPVTYGMAGSILSRLGQLKHCNNANFYKNLFRGKKVMKELKGIQRQAQRKEELTWNTYLEHRRTSKSLKQKAAPILT